MIALKELSRRTKATLCLGCGKCTGACPLADLGHGHSPRRLVQLALTDLTEGRALVRQCLTCGACEEFCPEGVQFVDFVRQVRAGLPPEERAPCPHHHVLAEATRLMTEGETTPGRLDWLTPDLKIAEKGDVYYFVGCLPLFDKVYEDLGVDMAEIARSTVRILNQLGIEPVVRQEEVCCGHDLLWQGDPESYEKLAKMNADLIAETGAKTVVTACAECARTLSLSHKEVLSDFKPEVIHMSALIAERLGDLDFSNGDEPARGKRTVTFQDPCRMSRHLEIVDEPRDVMEALPGIELREMEQSGPRSRCCGTAGFQHCDSESRMLQTMRLNEARATGADTMVTACPKCLVHFHCTQAEDERRNRLMEDMPETKRMRTEDLTVLVAEALAESGVAAAKGDE